MRGGYAVAAIFTFRIAWNEFILALILTGRVTYTLPVKTTLFMDEAGVRWGLIMAMGVLILTAAPDAHLFLRPPDHPGDDRRRRERIAHSPVRCAVRQLFNSMERT